jgi:hypothetical protein
MWLGSVVKTPKGKKPPERQLPEGPQEGREGSGRERQRTLEGSERSKEEGLFCKKNDLKVSQAKTSEVSRKAKDQRGSREPIRLLAWLMKNSKDLANPKRGRSCHRRRRQPNDSRSSNL